MRRRAIAWTLALLGLTHQAAARSTPPHSTPSIVWRTAVGDGDGFKLPLATDGAQVVVGEPSRLVTLDGRTGKRTGTSVLEGHGGDRVFITSTTLATVSDQAREGSMSSKFVLERIDRRGGHSIHDVVAGPRSAAVTGGTWWMVTDAGTLLAKGTGGAILSRTEVGPDATVSPSGPGLLLNGAGAVALYDPRGTLTWQLAAEGEPTPLAVAGRAGFAFGRRVGSATDVLGVDRVGNELWRTTLPLSRVWFAGASNGQRVFLVTETEDQGTLYALDLETGAIAWRQPVGVNANGHDFAPVVAGSNVVLWSQTPSAEGELDHDRSMAVVARDVDSGELAWVYRHSRRGIDPEKRLVTGPVFVAGRVVIADGHQVVGLDPPTGRGRGD